MTRGGVIVAVSVIVGSTSVGTPVLALAAGQVADGMGCCKTAVRVATRAMTFSSGAAWSRKMLSIIFKLKGWINDAGT